MNKQVKKSKVYYRGDKNIAIDQRPTFRENGAAICPFIHLLNNNNNNKKC